MSYEDIIKHIDATTNAFSSIKILVLTGGECFLLGEHLERIINYSTKKGLLTRVVTNAYWATSIDEAERRIKPLVDAGLTEINFSTGDNHQKFVAFDNIVNASLTSYELGIRTICINIESHKNAAFTLADIESNTLLSPLIESGNILCFEGAWMNFKKTDENGLDNLNSIPFTRPRPCAHLYNSIIINPYSELLACCGLTSEYNPYLKIGNLQAYSLIDLYDYQFNDLFKFWLYVDGPEYIYIRLMKALNSPRKRMRHECEYCMELVNSPEKIKVVGKLAMRELDGILYRNTLRIKHLKPKCYEKT